ncbi:hypothetical protein vseg_013409 [Gypsophila vaccaria]
MRRSSRLQGISPIDPSPEKSIYRRRRDVQAEVQITDLHTFECSPDESYTEQPSFEDDINTKSITDSIPNSITNYILAPTMPKLFTHSMPNAESIPSGFTMPETIQGNFEIKPAFLNLLERNQFGVNATEDPGGHMQMFTDYYSTIKQAGITQDQIREMLFPFFFAGSCSRVDH